MVECVHAHRSEEGWRLDLDGRTLAFSDGDEAQRAARMLARPGRLVIIDRREQGQPVRPTD